MADELQASVLSKARSNRIGMGGYFKILAFMRHRGRTTEAVCARFSLCHNTAGKLLRFMWRLKLIHREGWVRLVPHAPLVPVWRIRAAGDVERPGGDIKYTRQPAPWPTLITVATFIEVMQEAPRSISDLCADLAIHAETAGRIVNLMRDAGLSRIAHYEKLAIGHPVPYHGYLVHSDAALPGSADVVEARQRWRATHMQKKRHQRMLAATAGPVQANGG